jgi:hypothetical protein
VHGGTENDLHDLEGANNGSVIVLNSGRKIVEGINKQVVANPEVKRAYLGERRRAAAFSAPVGAGQPPAVGARPACG